MAEPWTADGERRGQGDLLVIVARERRQSQRDVHVGGGEDTRVVELGQQPRRFEHAADIEAVGLERERGHASASLSPSTTAADGRHVNTPQGTPSTTGVAAPTIPRTNRYATPARLRSGS